MKWAVCMRAGSLKMPLTSKFEIPCSIFDIHLLSPSEVPLYSSNEVFVKNSSTPIPRTDSYHFFHNRCARGTSEEVRENELNWRHSTCEATL